MHIYSSPITCSIVGARGYSGLEIARILLKHPAVKLETCFATQNFSLSQYLSNPLAQTIPCLPDSEIMNHLSDVVFLATPAEVSLELAPKILEKGKKVIDVSGAFRLKKNDYKKWYGFQHNQKNLLDCAVYGLQPWQNLHKNTALVANPGCYATAISLALIPLLKNELIKTDNISIDAKSGTSGAGRKASENMLFTEVDGECLPYKVGMHQHTPEILETIEMFSGVQVDPHFTTSLLPTRRGIIAGIYAQVSPTIGLEQIEKAFQNAYANYPLIQFTNLNKNSELLKLKKVVGTANCHISYQLIDQKLYLFSCIDNLLKGAASQAVENLNAIYQLPITTGLEWMEALT